MFFDRLDEPIIRFAADVDRGDVEPVVPALGQTWDTRVLVPPQAWGNGYDLPSGKAKLIGHMRNRVYLPRLMRFAQRDPNATGQLVMAAVMHSGQSMSAHPGGLQLESLFGDGPNLHGYLAGRPRGNSDPTGLFMAGDLVASAAMVGVRGLRGGLEGMTEQYAANLEDDLDWAMDWSRPDNDYSRLSSTWVGQSFMDGMYGGLIDGLSDAVSDMTWGAWPSGDEPGGPIIAAAGGVARKSAQGFVPSIGRHGGKLHQKRIYGLVRHAHQNLGVDLRSIRVNRQLIDPRTGATLSKLRPDLLGFNGRSLVVIGESCVSQSPSHAEKKLETMAKLYRELGFSVQKIIFDETGMRSVR